MRYILDSNILLNIIRGNKTVENELRKRNVYASGSAFVSVVNVGEILSISKQNNWGVSKQLIFEGLIKTFKAIPIQSRKLLDVYAEIDTYSKGKLTSRPLPKGLSARTMGKNDLWIAATTHLLNADIITNDNDFDHLDGIYFNVIKISTA